MGGSLNERTHLEELDVGAQRRDGQRRLGPGQTTPDHTNARLLRHWRRLVKSAGKQMKELASLTSG
jgi:hypothetical protein